MIKRQRGSWERLGHVFKIDNDNAIFKEVKYYFFIPLVETASGYN